MRHQAADLKAYDALCDEITAKGQKLATAFRISAPEKLTVKMKNKGNFKVTPFTGGEEFAFSSVYLGKRQQMIFCFRPMSAEVYDQMELSEDRLFDTFGIAVDLFKGISHFGKMEDAPEPYSCFTAARRVYCADFAKAATAKAHAEERRLQIEKEAELQPYQSNELFGMFG